MIDCIVPLTQVQPVRKLNNAKRKRRANISYGAIDRGMEFNSFDKELLESKFYHGTDYG